MTKLTERYELTPTNGRKSFYRKAMVCIYADGTRVLESYETPIIARTADGTLHRLYDGWSATTGTHIKSFCGLNKAEFFKLPYEESFSVDDCEQNETEGIGNLGAFLGRRLNLRRG